MLTNGDTNDSGFLFSQVLTVSQFKGASFFHFMVEQLPRLTAYIDFLKDNPQVLIHIQDSGVLKEILQYLGLNPSRVVTGEIRASILYAPAG